MYQNNKIVYIIYYNDYQKVIMSNEINDNDNKSVEAYIGLESEMDEGGPSICVEFPISLKVFFIAYALSLSEKKNI